MLPVTIKLFNVMKATIPGERGTGGIAGEYWGEWDAASRRKGDAGYDVARARFHAGCGGMTELT